MIHLMLYIFITHKYSARSFEWQQFPEFEESNAQNDMESESGVGLATLFDLDMSDFKRELYFGSDSNTSTSYDIYENTTNSSTHDLSNGANSPANELYNFNKPDSRQNTNEIQDGHDMGDSQPDTLLYTNLFDDNAIELNYFPLQESIRHSFGSNAAVNVDQIGLECTVADPQKGSKHETLQHKPVSSECLQDCNNLDGSETAGLYNNCKSLPTYNQKREMQHLLEDSDPDYQELSEVSSKSDSHQETLPVETGDKRNTSYSARLRDQPHAFETTDITICREKTPPNQSVHVVMDLIDDISKLYLITSNNIISILHDELISKNDLKLLHMFYEQYVTDVTAKLIKLLAQMHSNNTKETPSIDILCILFDQQMSNNFGQFNKYKLIITHSIYEDFSYFPSTSHTPLTYKYILISTFSREKGGTPSNILLYFGHVIRGDSWLIKECFHDQKVLFFQGMAAHIKGRDVFFKVHVPNIFKGNHQCDLAFSRKHKNKICAQVKNIHIFENYFEIAFQLTKPSRVNIPGKNQNKSGVATNSQCNPQNCCAFRIRYNFIAINLLKTAFVAVHSGDVILFTFLYNSTKHLMFNCRLYDQSDSDQHQILKTADNISTQIFESPWLEARKDPENRMDYSKPIN